MGFKWAIITNQGLTAALVRSYGLFHPNCRGKLDAARLQLGQPPYEPLTELPHAHELLLRMFPKGCEGGRWCRK
jgi:hypothetical protein